jgi:hypothetical protein
MIALAALAALALQDPASGTVLERTVQATVLDWLGNKREVHRRERVVLRGGNLSVTDLTFGERLVVRADQKKVWKADPLRGEYCEYGFDEMAAIRKAALDEVRAARARVPGTADERELGQLLEGYDQFDQGLRAELKSADGRRELWVNGDRVRFSAAADAKVESAPGYVEALAAIGAFPGAVADKLRELGGLPAKGTIRYVLFLERVIERYEVTSARAEPVPDAEFELPGNLARAPLRGFQRAPDRNPARPAHLQRTFKEDEIDRAQQTPPAAGEKKKE